MSAKQYLSEDTNTMFNECIHEVKLRDGVNIIDVYHWVKENVEITSTGFRPVIVNSKALRFKDKEIALFASLKWA